MVEQYANRPVSRIIACCRNPQAATGLADLKASCPQLDVQALDVADHKSIEALGQRLGDDPVDILINNAGIFGKSQPATTGFEDQVFGKSDFPEDWIKPFQVNAMGPMKMCETLVDNVAASELKKIVVITSIVASISGAFGQMFGYAASKAAANMTARNLAIALKPRGIIVNPIHPGYAKTDMGGEAAQVEVLDAVSGVLQRIDTMTMDGSGEFLSFDGSNLPW